MKSVQIPVRLEDHRREGGETDGESDGVAHLVFDKERRGVDFARPSELLAVGIKNFTDVGKIGKGNEVVAKIERGKVMHADDG